MKNIAHIAPKYKAYKYIPYYQNFSNTYLEPERFKEYMEAGCIDSTVGLAIATRPDCINDTYLEILKGIKETYGVDIYLEYGLQSVNYHTLEKSIVVTAWRSSLMRCLGLNVTASAFVLI